jgi:thioredoxin-dependent peroxiredoxin
MLNSMLVAGFLMGATPQVGEVAPDFTVKDTSGKSYTLSEMVKTGPVILAFFPKAFTGGCTKELTAYTERYADVQKLDGQLLAVSTDAPQDLVKFKESLKAPFAFVPDPDATLTSLYDVKMPVMNLANRYTFVIGEERKILKVDSGKDAIDPKAAIASCPLRKKADAAAKDASKAPAK